MAHYQATLSERDFRSLSKHLEKLALQYRVTLEALPPGPDRAKAVHRLINQQTEGLQAIPITCAKGCSGCCHLEVEITQDEGELLAQTVLDGHRIDRDRLRKQASRVRNSAEWNSLVAPENRCVFLAADDACSVYESRPSICRKHLVISPPSECTASNGAPHPVSIPLAELVISTAIGLQDNPYASLSKSVEAALAKFEHLKVGAQQFDVPVEGEDLPLVPCEEVASDEPYLES